MCNHLKKQSEINTTDGCKYLFNTDLDKEGISTQDLIKKKQQLHGALLSTLGG